MQKYGFDHVSILQEEWQNVLLKKNLKHLVFCSCKYHSDDYTDILKNYNTIQELDEDAISISKSKNEKKNEMLHQCITEIEKSYKHLNYQLTNIRKNFNVNDLDLNKIDNDSIRFWYELLLRIHLRPNIWSTIGKLHNYKRTGFLTAYDALKTKEEKKSFMEEINFFVNGCINITAKRKNESDVSLLKKNIYNVINYELLDLKCFFETYDFRDYIREIKILDTNEMLKNPVFLKKINTYREYLNRIKTSVKDCIDTINKEFATSEFPLFCETSDSVDSETSDSVDSETSNNIDNLDQSKDEPLIIEKLAKKLKETDAVAYKRLTDKNYDKVMLQSDPNLTNSEQQIQHDKIQKDLMKIIEENNELIGEAVDEFILSLL